MKRYETYKESHQDFGEIPVNWNTTKLKFIASEDKNSFVDGPFGSDLKNEEYVESGIPVIQLNSIKEGKLRLNNFKYVTDEKASSLFRHTAFPGDLVIAKMAAPIARSAVVPDTFEKYIIVADCIKLKTKKHQNVSFINYVMNTPFIVAQAERFANGTTRSRVNLGIIKNLVIPLPSYEEQLEIVKFLDYKIQKIDQLIESVQKKVDLLEQQCQSIITEALTKGLNPNEKMKDSGVEWIGEIPEHWCKLKLKYLTRQIIDGTHHTPDYQDEGIPFLRVTDITKSKGKEINLKDVKYISQKEHSELVKRCRPEKGDLLVSKNGTIGVPKVIDWDWEFSIFVSLCLIKLNKNKLNPYFASFYFESKLVDEQIAFGSKKSTIMNLHLDKVKEFFIFVPPLSEQDEIVKYLQVKVSEVEISKRVVENQIEKLKEYRQSLIYEAVTGKIDVRDIELDEVR